MLTTERQPDYFGKIFLWKAKLGKYLNKKCLSEYYQQFSFKYSVKSLLIQVIVKSIKNPDNRERGTLKNKWVKKGRGEGVPSPLKINHQKE